MIPKLIKLSNALRLKGLTKESYHVDILIKEAQEGLFDVAQEGAAELAEAGDLVRNIQWRREAWIEQFKDSPRYNSWYYWCCSDLEETFAEWDSVEEKEAFEGIWGAPPVKSGTGELIAPSKIGLLEVLQENVWPVPAYHWETRRGNVWADRDAAENVNKLIFLRAAADLYGVTSWPDKWNENRPPDAPTWRGVFNHYNGVTDATTLYEYKHKQWDRYHERQGDPEPQQMPWLDGDETQALINEEASRITRSMTEAPGGNWTSWRDYD